jgi:hypothetical protein
VRAAFVVRQKDGRVLAAAPASAVAATSEGGLSRSFGIPLDGASAGAYELLVVVEDEASGHRAEARETFFVEREPAR